MKLHIGGVSLFLALSGLPLGIANALTKSKYFTTRKHL